MSDKVVSLADRLAQKKQDEHDERHCTGEAQCLHCKHIWIAVAPIGTTFLECPECTRFFGRYRGVALRPGPHWHCLCGCDVFRATPEISYCVDCGKDVYDIDPMEKR